jgi:CheY-like chemotaxis protein
VRPLKVLLVDDDTSIRAMLRIAFSVEEGVGEVREAADGEQAVRVCDNFAPDLIFLDYWMPGMDGATAAAQIRGRYPAARIIAFSGVLDNKPEWADYLYIKGDMPNLEVVIDLVKAESV